MTSESMTKQQGESNGNRKKEALITTPFTIEGKQLSIDEFVLKVNQAYKQSVKGWSGYRHGKPFYQCYQESASASPRLQAQLKAHYSELAVYEFNGLDVWRRRFERFVEKSERHYLEALGQAESGATSYLQDVLVERVKRFAEERGVTPGKPFESISDYADYLHTAIELGFSPAVDLQWHEDSGWGVYAQEDIAPFTYLGLYGGEIRLKKWTRLMERLRHYPNKYKWVLYGNDRFIIDSERRGGLTRFVNHDVKRTRRVETFSIKLVDGLPNRGLIAVSPEARQNPSLYPFDSGEQVVWDYGNGECY